MAYTLIDHGNDAVKCPKFAVKFEFWTFYYVIYMAYKSVDHEKMSSICLEYMCKQSSLY